MLLPANPLSEIDGFEIILGKYRYLFFRNDTPFNTSSSAFIAINKYASNQLLARHNIPVPKSIVLNKEDFIEDELSTLIASLQFPLVIKPISSSLGAGVLCNIKNIALLKKHLIDYFAAYDCLVIEEFHGQLNSYRVLVFKNKVIGIVLRHPAQVTGDGIHNIEELINITNERRKEREALGPIVIDTECAIRLQELGITPAYVPNLGETIILCYTSNATRGGTFTSLKTQVCSENKTLFCRVAQVLNLTLVGIDVECEDLNIPLESSQGVIIEVNHRPSIRIHELPLAGTPHFVSRAIMKSFIFRHPFAYLYAVYTNKRIIRYLKSFIVLIIFSVLYRELIS